MAKEPELTKPEKPTPLNVPDRPRPTRGPDKARGGAPSHGGAAGPSRDCPCCK